MAGSMSMINTSTQLPTPTPASEATAKGFEQAMYSYPGYMDDRSHVWIAASVIYTFFLCVGMTILYFQRFTQAVRIRCYWTTFGCVFSLHLYLFCILIVYPLRWWYGCTVEFWVMAIVFPLGLSLYQVSNARFIYFYQTQQELLVKPHRNQRRKGPCACTNPIQFVRNFACIDFLTKIRIFIYIGMSVTIISSCVIFFGSRNFHADYGFFGEWTGESNCHRGPRGEWAPTAIWQFVVCYFWGPFMLWHARNIKDTHFWSVQTKINIIAGLPGTPLWLTFLYSNNPTIIKINRYFPHAGWFIPCIVMIQWTSIICPILDSYRARTYIVKMDSESEIAGSGFSVETGPVFRILNKSLYSMAALDEALEKNAAPLVTWAANRNFTAADVNFLLYVRNWKNQWGGPGRRNRALNSEQARSRFEDAAIIFFTFINPHTSRVTINIDDHTYKKVAKFFENLGYDIDEEGASFFSAHHQVAPWEGDESIHQALQLDHFDKRRLQRFELDDVEDSDEECGSIPRGFSLSVFDDAYRIVRDDIFYNTWLRYVTDLETHGSSTDETMTFCSNDHATPSPRMPPPACHPW